MQAEGPLIDRPLAQVGFVVSDMDAALRTFTPLYGPFVRQRFADRDFAYRGRRSHYILDVAFAMHGEVEIELICPVAGDGPHSEFIESGQAGLHHLQYRYEDIDRIVPQFEAAGHRCVWYQRMGKNAAVAYLEPPGGGLILELVEPLVRAQRVKAGSQD